MQITHTHEQIIERLRDIISTRLDLDIRPEQIGPADGFQSTLGIDSIGFIELRYQCEEAFGIKIDDNDFTPEHFSNCEVLSRFLLTRLDT